MVEETQEGGQKRQILEVLLLVQRVPFLGSVGQTKIGTLKREISVVQLQNISAKSAFIFTLSERFISHMFCQNSTVSGVLK